MRGRLGMVLAGVGAFLMIAGVLVRLYAYDQLAVAPQGQNSVTTLVGPGATIFDRESVEEITTDLVTKVRTVGDVPAAEEAGGNTVVWVSASSTRSSDGTVRSRSIERLAFDAHTAEAENCCGEFVETTEGERTPVEHEGLLVKFPFNTQKEAYDFWDGTLEATFPARYVGTEDILGLSTYKFQQRIPAEVVSTVEVPASYLGLEEDGNVDAERVYSNDRTMWVEPNTGVIINREEQQVSTLRYEGVDRVTLTEVTTSFDDETVQGNVDKYGSLGSALALVTSPLPWVVAFIGLLLMVGGIILARGRDEEQRL